MIRGPLLDVFFRVLGQGVGGLLGASGVLPIPRSRGLDERVAVACWHGIFAVTGRVDTSRSPGADPKDPAQRVQVMSPKGAASIRAVMDAGFQRRAEFPIANLRRRFGSHLRCIECLDQGETHCPWCEPETSPLCETCRGAGVRPCPCRTRDMIQAVRFFSVPLDTAALKRMVPDVEGAVLRVAWNQGGNMVRISSLGWSSWLMGVETRPGDKLPSFWGEA